MTNIFTRSLCALICTILLVPSTLANDTVPMSLNYSGTLLDSSGNPTSEIHTFRFSLWNSADIAEGDMTTTDVNESASTHGGWLEIQDITPRSDGSFSTQVGRITPLPRLSYQRHQYLQVEIRAPGEESFRIIDHDEADDSVDRMQLASSPFAIQADQVDGRDVGSEPGNIAVLNREGTWRPSQIPGGTTAEQFQLDVDGSGGSLAVSFGTTEKEIRYDTETEKFIVNDGIFVDDNIAVQQDIFVEGLVDGRDIAADGIMLDQHSADIAALSEERGSDRTLLDEARSAIELLQGVNPTDTLVRIFSREEVAEESVLVRCQSQHFAEAICTLDFTGLRLELVEQISKAPCIAGETYYLSSDGRAIVANAGCRGDFNVITREASSTASEAEHTLGEAVRLLSQQIFDLRDELDALPQLPANLPQPNSNTGTVHESFVLDADQSGGDTSLQFGVDAPAFTWNKADNSISLNTKLTVGGVVNGRDIATDGATLDQQSTDIQALQAENASLTARVVELEALASRVTTLETALSSFASAAVAEETDNIIRIVAQGDQYRGTPKMRVHVNGERLGETMTVSAERSNNEDQVFELATDEDIEMLEIEFVNDAFSRTNGDRNLFILSTEINSETLDLAKAEYKEKKNNTAKPGEMFWKGKLRFTFDIED